MKKLLSIILACAMIMSFFCVVPASALGPTDYADNFALPNAFTDFENSRTIFDDGQGYTSEVIDSGLTERGKVARLTVDTTINGAPNLWRNIGAIRTPLSIGDKITISMWIKTSTELRSAFFSVIINSMDGKVTEGTLSNNGYQVWDVPFDKSSTDWQYVTKTFESTFSTEETTHFQYRLGNAGGPNEAVDRDNIKTIEYFIDDFQIKIEKPGDDVDPIVGTTLTQEAGSVTVATDTALTDAKLIFVTYDANHKMVDWESANVTLDAQASQTYAPVDLTTGSYTKAMLWSDMDECIPLADMIQY